MEEKVVSVSVLEASREGVRMGWPMKAKDPWLQFWVGVDTTLAID